MRLRKESTSMPINFPNPSRSYDGTRQAVHFWGYDLWMERSFFITADALSRIKSTLCVGELDLLRVFDVNRELIYAVAAKVYGRGRKGSYELTAADV